MTDQGHMWFQYLTTAHVQTGKYEVAETYLPGKHSMPRTVQNDGLDPVTDAEPMPETFQREWATFVTGTDAQDSGYDPGSYGIGVQVHTRTITVPRVTPVHLLYYFSVSGTKEERILVQAPATADGIANPQADLGVGGAGLNLNMVGANLSRNVRSFEDYVADFAPQGFNRYGFVLPRAVSRSKASELHSFTGTFTDVDDNEAVYTTYIEPMYINNDRPLFDFIYLQTDITDLDSNVMQIPSRLLRWRGEVTSEHISPINRAGDAIRRDGYRYGRNSTDTAFTGEVSSPQPHIIEIDGVTYTNADGYNKGYKRQ